MEIWKDVVGYEGFYSVSSFGRVRREISGYGNCIAGKILKQSVQKNGYFKIDLRKNNIPRTFTIHSLVARHFIGERPDGLEINHKDGIKSHNYVSNLEYVTCSENQNHGFKLGIRKSPFGNKHWATKLSDKKVMEIRAEYAKGGTSYIELGLKHNVSSTHIGKIIRKESWNKS